ncbi:MAG TPA: hypothetical protein VMI33_13380 [Streptosporangiaceae bacterium]|nr:hypothetical protein [Streptosporangiaceae bacterium]
MLEVLGDRARADVDRAGDGQVGAPPGGQPEDLDLAVGEPGQAVGVRRGQGGAGPLLAARPPQGPAQRFGQGAQQGPVGLGEIALGPVERDGQEQVVRRAGQAEGHLVLDRDVAEELRVQAEPVELLAVQEVTDLGRRVGTVSAVVDEQRVLMQVGLEIRERRRVKRADRIIGVISELIRLAGDLVVCHDIAAHQRGQARQDKLGRLCLLVEIGETIEKPGGPLQRLQ